MDAIVALLIVSLTLVLSFTAMQAAQGSAERAEEIRQADVLLRSLMIDGVPSLLPASGSTGGFTWTLDTEALPAPRAIALCSRRVDIRAVRSARRYGAVSLETCPAPAP